MPARSRRSVPGADCSKGRPYRSTKLFPRLASPSPPPACLSEEEMLRQCAHRPKAIQAPFDVGFGLVPMSDSSSPGCRSPGRRRARVTEALLRCGVSRRRRTRTTRGDSGRRAAPDRIERQFDADLPDRLWVPDMLSGRTRGRHRWRDFEIGYLCHLAPVPIFRNPLPLHVPGSRSVGLPAECNSHHR